jgi:hypothetical protein
MNAPFRWMMPVFMLLAAFPLLTLLLPGEVIYGVPGWSLAAGVSYMLAELIGLLYLYLTGRLRRRPLNWAFIALIPFWAIGFYVARHPAMDSVFIFDLGFMRMITLLLYLYWTIRKSPKRLLDYLKLLFLFAESLWSILLEFGSHTSGVTRWAYPGVMLLLMVMVALNYTEQRKRYRTGDELGMTPGDAAIV